MANFWLICILLFSPLLVSGLLLFTPNIYKFPQFFINCLAVFANVISLTIAFVLTLNNNWQAGDVNKHLWQWLKFGEFQIDFSLTLNSFSGYFLLFILTVSLLVQIYAFGYIKWQCENNHSEYQKSDYQRFFALMNLFIFAMLLFVLADDLLILFIAWELISLCSFLLIGFNYRQIAVNVASLKAFIIGRIGDVGLLIGICLLIIISGESKIDLVIAYVSEALQGISPQNDIIINWQGLSLSKIALSLILLGLISKSAQFPLSFWLPTAMVAPTPVSALIHSATMVAAGIYLIVILMPLYSLSPAHSQFLFVLGVFGAFVFSLIATTARDIKLILANSTIAHLAIITVFLSSTNINLIIDELIFQGLAKVILFLIAGLLFIKSASQNIDEVGNLRKSSPLIFSLWVVAALIVLPIFPFSNFTEGKRVMETIINNLIIYDYYIYWGLIGYYIFSAIYTGKLILYLGFINQNTTKINNSDEKIFSAKIFSYPIIILTILLIIVPPLYSYVLSGSVDFAVDLPLTKLLFWLSLIGATISILIYYQYPRSREIILQNKIAQSLYQFFANYFYVERLINYLIKLMKYLGNELYQLFEKFIFANLLKQISGLLYTISQSFAEIENVDIGKQSRFFIFAILLLLVIFVWLI